MMMDEHSCIPAQGLARLSPFLELHLPVVRNSGAPPAIDTNFMVPFQLDVMLSFCDLQAVSSSRPRTSRFALEQGAFRTLPALSEVVLLRTVMNAVDVELDGFCQFLLAYPLPLATGVLYMGLNALGG